MRSESSAFGCPSLAAKGRRNRLTTIFELPCHQRVAYQPFPSFPETTSLTSGDIWVGNTSNYNPAKTIVDLFRYRRSAGKRYKTSPGLNIALEGLREALRRRKATPAQIAEYATEAGIWKVVQPYLEAMTANA